MLFNFPAKAQSIKLAAEKYLNDLIDISEMKFEKLRLEREMKFKIENETGRKLFGDFVYYWQIKSVGDKYFSALLDNAMGKSQPITFIVVFDENKKIFSVSIIKYRESHGGEVQNKAWLREFEGKDFKSDFRPGADIDAISGATISVNSVSRGIKNLAILIKEMNDDK